VSGGHKRGSKSGVELILNGISLVVSKRPLCSRKKVKKQILENIHAKVKPGSLFGIIGASGTRILVEEGEVSLTRIAGAGKTSLLDIIAGFSKSGKVTGEILVNGKPVPKNYKYMTGYEAFTLGKLWSFDCLWQLCASGGLFITNLNCSRAITLHS